MLQMQPDADLPVEAERRDGRLDEVADVADDAVGQLRRRVGTALQMDGRNLRQHPERKRYGNDDGARVLHEDARAIEQPQPERVERGHAVLRQLQNEGRVTGFENGALEQARGGEGGDESREIEAEHDERAQAENAVQEISVGNESGDEQQIHRQPRRAGHEGRDQESWRGGRACSRWCAWP